MQSADQRERALAQGGSEPTGSAAEASRARGDAGEGAPRDHEPLRHCGLDQRDVLVARARREAAEREVRVPRDAEVRAVDVTMPAGVDVVEEVPRPHGGRMLAPVVDGHGPAHDVGAERELGREPGGLDDRVGIREREPPRARRERVPGPDRACEADIASVDLDERDIEPPCDLERGVAARIEDDDDADFFPGQTGMTTGLRERGKAVPEERFLVVGRHYDTDHSREELTRSVPRQGFCLRRGMSMKTSRLVKILLPEACQTEQSAKTHCAREAKRLGHSPPGLAMTRASNHAASKLRGLERLAEARGVTVGRGVGNTVGRVFSVLRRMSSDLFGSEEKSFRATILGLQHGRGVFLLLEDAAVASGDQELADFCAELLAQRDPIVAEAERDLSWFAENEKVALTRAVLLPGGGATGGQQLADAARSNS